MTSLHRNLDLGLSFAHFYMQSLLHETYSCCLVYYR